MEFSAESEVQSRQEEEARLLPDRQQSVESRPGFLRADIGDGDRIAVGGPQLEFAIEIQLDHEPFEHVVDFGSAERVAQNLGLAVEKGRVVHGRLSTQVGYQLFGRSV